MITLGIDASALKTSLGLISSTGEVMAFSETLKSFEHLPLFVYHALEQNKYQLSDIKKIGLIMGPGNYTGLRCSLLMAKSFASIYPIQLVGRNRLDTIIFAHRSQEKWVMASQYVRMNQYYISIGRYLAEQIEYQLPPQLVSEAEWETHSQSKSLLIIGDQPNGLNTELELGTVLSEWVFTTQEEETRLEPFYIRPAVS